MNGTGRKHKCYVRPCDGGGWAIWCDGVYLTYRIREEDALAEAERRNDELQVFDSG